MWVLISTNGRPICPQLDSILSPFSPSTDTSNISNLIGFSALCLEVCSAHWGSLLSSEIPAPSSRCISKCNHILLSIPKARKELNNFSKWVKNIPTIPGRWTKVLKVACLWDTILPFTFMSSKNTDYLHRSWQSADLWIRDLTISEMKLGKRGRRVISTGTGRVWYPKTVAGIMKRNSGKSQFPLS